MVGPRLKRCNKPTTGQMPRKLNTTLLFYTQDLDGSTMTVFFSLHPSTRNIKKPQMDAIGGSDTRRAEHDVVS
jgi:hypothetical protein